jgi:hypothetical protein
MKYWSRKLPGTSCSLGGPELADENARTEPDQLPLCIGSCSFSFPHVDRWGQSQ